MLDKVLRLGVVAVLGVLAVVVAPATAGTALAGGETAYREFGIVTGPPPAGAAAAVSQADARATLASTGLDRTGLAPGTPSAQLRSFRSGEFRGLTRTGKSTLAWIFTYHHSPPFNSRPPRAPVLTTVPDCDFVLAVDATTGSPLSTFQTCWKGATPAPPAPPAPSPALPPALPGTVGPCSAFVGNWFTGYYHDPNSSHRYEGASSYIINGGATVCTTVSNQSNMAAAWSMVASADAQGWAQSGFAGWPGAGNHWFAQLSPDGHDILQTWFSSGRIPVGQQDAYRALYNAACTCIQASVNGAVVLASVWSPYAEWTLPFTPQFFGEVTRFESNMPGTTAQHTKFWAMGGQRWTDDVLEGMPCTLIGDNNDPTRWHYSASSCTAFDLWSTPDPRCSATTPSAGISQLVADRPIRADLLHPTTRRQHRDDVDQISAARLVTARPPRLDRTIRPIRFAAATNPVPTGCPSDKFRSTVISPRHTVATQQ